MPLLRMRVAAAKYALGPLRSEELPRLADGAIDRGLCSPTLAELWLTRNPTLREAGPLFEKALRELGIPVPDRGEAALTLLKYYTGRIVEGALLPEEGM